MSDNVEDMKCMKNKRNGPYIIRELKAQLTQTFH